MSRDRDREKKRDQEDEEDAYERRKLERKLRDKEAAYQEVRADNHCMAKYLSFSCCMVHVWIHKSAQCLDLILQTRRSGCVFVFVWDNLALVVYTTLYLRQRLKNWELRERKKARDNAKESERDDERRREMVRSHWMATYVHRVLFWTVACTLPFFNKSDYYSA